MLRSILAQNIAVCETRDDGRPCEEIFSEEIACLSANAVNKRRYEFWRGRLCAHETLKQLGHAPSPVLMAADRRPLWPSGIVGSISHTQGYTAAIAASSQNYASLGLDIENIRAFGADLQQRVCTDSECLWLNQRPDPELWGLIHFSAKETLHKALHPLTGITLGFLDAEIEFDLLTNKYSIRFEINGKAHRWTGKYLHDAQHVFTAIQVEAKKAAALF